MLDGTQNVLLQWLSASLSGSKYVWTNGAVDFDEIVRTAKQHAVLPLLYEAADESEELSESCRQRLAKAAAVTVRTNYRLLLLTKYITGLFQKNGIHAVVLKGAATAAFYPVPELRKAGDVDLWIAGRAKLEKAAKLLEEEGFVVCETQTALHHIELSNAEGIVVELHGSLAEPFESKRANRYLEEFQKDFGKHIETDLSWGIPIVRPTDAHHAFYLIVHMLQHFLRAGFGLKFLCDWVVFWNRDVSEHEKNNFLNLVKESGTSGFVAVLTAACVRYLGLCSERVLFMQECGHVSHEEVTVFMEEVFAAGEFGHEEKNRMVAMRGTGLLAYVREFHHQMHLNYPLAGHVFLCWPVLWAATLFRFYHNNHALRGVRGRDVLKEAGKRSRLIHKMKLFD